MASEAKPLQYLTLRRIPLDEAMRRLDDPLPAKAYKEISGGKGKRLGLTDIDPSYLPPLLTSLFGPPGYGWGLDIRHCAPDDYTRYTPVKENNRIVTDEKGRAVMDESHEYWAHAIVRVWYRFIVVDPAAQTETIVKSEGLDAPGASHNDRKEWSMKGAVTNAMGTAWYFHGFQTSVYKGERGHRNPTGGQKPEGDTSGDDTPKNETKPELFLWEASRTTTEGIESLQSCKTLDELKSQWGDIRGNVNVASLFWQSIGEEDRKALEREKDALKGKLKK